jgi:hypothetical protein
MTAGSAAILVLRRIGYDGRRQFSKIIEVTIVLDCVQFFY